MELTLDGRQIFKNISVIELKVIENRCSRCVVDEFRSLVKKCRIVFISLHKKSDSPSEADRGKFFVTPPIR